jgi:NAD(P)-dependent dehydrogenase (short-subunit alcohol dehydrogenase family)
MPNSAPEAPVIATTNLIHSQSTGPTQAPSPLDGHNESVARFTADITSALNAGATDSITGNRIVNNQVVVITGATSGIGQSAAEQLARIGARIVQIARDRDRGELAFSRLRKLTPHINHAIHYCDLSLISEVKRVAAQISASEPRIDVLINNAGAIFSSPELTSEGLERTFALNHMAYFVLTRCLMDRLVASAPARIVNTSSDAYKAFPLDFEDLQSIETYGERNILELLIFGGPGYKAYARSKLCNVLFTRELARRLGETNVTVNCLHPGLVATRFADSAGGLISFRMRIMKRFALAPEKGGERIVQLAADPEVAEVTGTYFTEGHPISMDAAATNDFADRLWRESSALANLPVE